MNYEYLAMLEDLENLCFLFLYLWSALIMSLLHLALLQEEFEEYKAYIDYIDSDSCIIFHKDKED